VLHFELYWINAVGPVYEKVLELVPEDTAVRWRLVDIYEMTSDVDGAERQFREILKRNPNDVYAAHFLKHFKEFYD
jgi:predicted TPR repeat methyltransferase